MSFKNCVNCRKPCDYQSEDKMSVFCTDCFQDYQQAGVQIHEYMMSNPLPRGYKVRHIPMLVTELSLPRVFVEKFFQEADRQMDSMHSGSDAFCVRCQHRLKFAERTYCTSCKRHVAGIIHGIIRQCPDVAQRHEQRQLAAKRAGNRYGLSRV